MVSSPTSNQGVISTGGWIHAADYISTPLIDGVEDEMNVDGSSTAVPYLYIPPASYAATIHRLTMFIETGTAMDTELFGNLAELTNGVVIQVTDNGVTTILDTWHSNADMLLDMYDFGSAGAIFGKSTKVATGRWSFYRATGGSRGIYVPKDGSFKAVVQDDLRTLVHFHVHVQGYLCEG